MSNKNPELRKARNKAAQNQKQAEAPPVDNRVRVVTYIDRDGKEQTEYCQDFKAIGGDVNGCAIMWLGETVENDPGRREIVGQTHGIKEWTTERLDITWEVYLATE